MDESFVIQFLGGSLLGDLDECSIVESLRVGFILDEPSAELEDGKLELETSSDDKIICGTSLGFILPQYHKDEGKNLL